MNKKTYGNDLWNIITKEVEKIKSSDPELEDFLEKNILFFDNLFDSVTNILTNKLSDKKDSVNFLIEKIKPLAVGNSGLFKYSEQAILDYSTIGGTPHLDGGYTVFGEVVEGLEIIDQICNSVTLNGDRPTEDIKIIAVQLIE